MTEAITKEQAAAIRLLKGAGFGVISPGGHCLGNVGFFPDGSMVVSTRSKPVYGMLGAHQGQAAQRPEDTA